MTDTAALRELLAAADMPTLAVNPDDRPGMGWNDEIIHADEPYLRVAFMADAGEITNHRTALIVAAVNALPALIDEIERGRDFARAIAEGDETRPVGKAWFPDGRPSKHDQCKHGVWMYETCGQCVSDFARAFLDTRAAEAG